MGEIVISEVAKDLIINIINIIVLFLIVRALVYKPVRKFLDERTERVNNTLSEADKKLSEANETIKHRDEIISEGERIASQKAKETEAEARQNAERIIADANSRAESIIEKSRKEIKDERDKMIASAKGEIAGLAVDISERILKREVGPDDTARIVEEYFAESKKA